MNDCILCKNPLHLSSNGVNLRSSSDCNSYDVSESSRQCEHITHWRIKCLLSDGFLESLGVYENIYKQKY